jgi:hypothetical protein
MAPTTGVQQPFREVDTSSEHGLSTEAQNIRFISAPGLGERTLRSIATILRQLAIAFGGPVAR